MNAVRSCPDRSKRTCKLGRNKDNSLRMNRVPHQPEDLPNLISTGPGTLERLLNCLDPGPAEESEAFVRLIYEQRRSDASINHNDETRC